MNIKGSCLCETVNYQIDAKPIVTRACWCKPCQKLASGNATINLAFPKAAVNITGLLNDYVSIADDGNHMHRKFCPNCGTHVYSEAEERPDIIVIKAGTLDESSLIELEGIIWVSSAPSWAYLDPNMPHFEKQPPAPVVNKEKN